MRGGAVNISAPGSASPMLNPFQPSGPDSNTLRINALGFLYHRCGIVKTHATREWWSEYCLMPGSIDSDHVTHRRLTASRHTIRPRREPDPTSDLARRSTERAFRWVPSASRPKSTWLPRCGHILGNHGLVILPPCKWISRCLRRSVCTWAL